VRPVSLGSERRSVRRRYVSLDEFLGAGVFVKHEDYLAGRSVREGSGINRLRAANRVKVSSTPQPGHKLPLRRAESVTSSGLLARAVLSGGERCWCRQRRWPHHRQCRPFTDRRHVARLLQRLCNRPRGTKRTVAANGRRTTPVTPSYQNRAGDPPIQRSDGDGTPLARDVVAAPGHELGFERFGSPPPTRDGTTPTPCGHTRHIGTCPTCQRVQLTRWRHQLRHAKGAAPASGKEARE